MPADAGLLATAYDGITAVVDGRNDADLRRPTRCRGWTVADLLFHQLLDAQRALIALASPVDAAPDVDGVTYWAPHKPGAPWASDHEKFIRGSVAAHTSPQDVVRVWIVTSAAAARAAAAAPPAQCVTTQRHVLTVADLVSTLVVEAAVHHLDLAKEDVAEIDLRRVLWSVDPTLSVEGPMARNVEDMALIFDAMLGGRSPAGWATVDYVLAATGRTDAATLQPPWPGASDRFPLLG